MVGYHDGERQVVAGVTNSVWWDIMIVAATNDSVRWAP